MPMDGKVAIVTGAAAGLGRSVARCYAKRGARVVVADINDEKGEETVRLITDAGGTASFRHADSSSLEENEALVAFARETYGKLDIACNNAGIAPPSTPLAEVSAELWRRTLSIDLDGVFFGIKAQIPAMLDNGGGTIVNMASILGQVGFLGLGPYVAAKHAVVGLTKQIAVDYAAQGIRAISIGPAFIKTGLEAALDEKSRAELDSSHPVGRMGEPDEVGEVVAAVSESSWSFVNGAYIPVDGGYLSR
ncbi:SDR family NAD(P)-dependent oxidoreductase [Georgenia sp. SYP-B2076]|uniref:SDR family NAD(P)-dependent oxidoreductase n=1 Tax=Georgenia sp. SYP-B2076 TaxID=2495881 RepID=UPI000F8C52CD|nr:SDR family oxidoreductase [Georgenia sp. SYP-B2076]